MSKANALHIGIYGRRNVGKSTLINAITQQEVAIVSPTAGTTTDPVKRSFELLAIGAVVFIDTAGVDDSADELGRQRVKKTNDSIQQVDIAILVIAQPHQPLSKEEKALIHEFERLRIPYLTVCNQIEKIQNTATPSSIITLNAKTGEGINNLLSKLASIAKSLKSKTSLLGDIINARDLVLLITPTDSEAPEGRLILPQVNTIRDIIDSSAIAVVLKENELEYFLSTVSSKPAIAVTDSQLFKKVGKLVPSYIPLTSFSILLARQKGNFEAFLKGTPYISQLKDGDRILILESCSHQTSCEDIGRIKIPRWLETFTGKKLLYDIVSKLDTINRPIAHYALAIQCGGCMVTRRQLTNRLQPFIDAEIPVTNYGMAIAYTQGVFNRAIQLFT